MNKEQRIKRNAEIVEQALNGVTTKDIAKKFNLERNSIYQLLRDHGVEPVSKTFENRKLFLELSEIHSGAKLRKELEEAGMSYYHIRRLFRENGMELPLKNSVKYKSYRSSRVITVISMLLKGEGRRAITEKVICSRQYVAQVARQCEQEGIELP